MEQVPIESGVVNFEIISIELVSQAVTRFQRSESFSYYLVTFEIAFEVAEGIETSEQVGEIFSKIENLKPGSIEVTDKQMTNEEGEVLGILIKLQILL